MTAFVFTPAEQSTQWDMEVQRALGSSSDIDFATEAVHSFSGGICYHECLARSKRVPSRALFSWANTMGMALELETYTITKIFERYSGNKSGRIGINISPEVISSTAVLSLLGSQSPQLVLEVSELAPAFEIQSLVLALSGLRKDGVMVALDNFGVGNAGLRLLVELEPDWVKIDRSLIAQIDNPKIRSAIKTLIEMAHDAGARVITVGIETLDQLEVVDKLGADGWQGYLQPPDTWHSSVTRIGSLTRSLPSPESAALWFCADDSIEYALSYWLHSGLSFKEGYPTPALALVARGNEPVGWLFLSDLIEAYTQHQKLG